MTAGQPHLLPDDPAKVEYRLTALGESFREPIRALGLWALENLPQIDAAREE